MDLEYWTVFWVLFGAFVLTLFIVRLYKVFTDEEVRAMLKEVSHSVKKAFKESYERHRKDQ